MRGTLLLLMLLRAASGALPQSSQSSAPSDAEIRQILLDRVDVRHQSVGIVVGVIGQEGRRVVAYGHLEKGDARPLDGDIVFEIGSVTKVFTSLLLAAMVSGPPTFEIFPEAERDYFYNVINAQFTFVTNRRGKATELILHQNGLGQHAKQIE